MRKPKALIIAAIILIITSACSGLNISNVGVPAEGKEYRLIKADEALELIGQERVHLIDVRNADEFINGYIKGMVNIRLNDLETKIGQEVSDKDDVIIVYCASGIRSAKAARMLCNAGYKNVFDLGGLESWPYEIQFD